MTTNTPVPPVTPQNQPSQKELTTDALKRLATALALVAGTFLATFFLMNGFSSLHLFSGWVGKFVVDLFVGYAAVLLLVAFKSVYFGPSFLKKAIALLIIFFTIILAVIYANMNKVNGNSFPTGGSSAPNALVLENGQYNFVLSPDTQTTGWVKIPGGKTYYVGSAPMGGFNITYSDGQTIQVLMGQNFAPPPKVEATFVVQSTTGLEQTITITVVDAQ